MSNNNNQAPKQTKPNSSANKANGAKSSKKKKSTPVGLIAVVGIVCIGALVFALSALTGNDEPTGLDIPNINSSSQVSAVEPSSSEEEISSSEAPVVDASSSEAPASSTAPAASSAPAPVTQTLPTSFDPSSVNDSGADGIDDAKAVNSDVRGWLKVPGTNVDYPVLYHATDVNYYLAKGLDKSYSKDGVVWADPETMFGTADEISRNTVLYGHNWTNISANPRIYHPDDVMFGQLAAYHHLNFAKVTPYIYYSTEAEEMLWQVFAVFYTDIGFNYIASDPGDAEFASIIKGAQDRSRHDFDVDVNINDKILTLSTCTRAYGSSADQRFVIMAKLMEPGDAITAVTVTSNPDPILPRL